MASYKFYNLEVFGTFSLLKPPSDKKGIGFTVGSEFGSRFYVKGLGEVEVRVPKGLYTDLGSIPIGLRNLFNRIGPSKVADVEHDYLFKYAHWIVDGELVLVDQRIVDAYHRWRQIQDGVSKVKARSKWLGLRAFGWIQWRKYRKLETLERGVELGLIQSSHNSSLSQFRP